MFNELLKSKLSHVVLFRVLITILSLTTLANFLTEGKLLSLVFAFGVIFSILLKMDDKWSVLAILFLGASISYNVATNYLTVSNHHFLIFYLTIVFVFSLHFKPKERGEFIEKQLVIIFGLVMLLSGLQKLTSSDFISGNFMGYLFYSGGLTKVLSNIDPINKFVSDNQKLLEQILEIDPLQKNEFSFYNYNKDHIFWLKITSWLIILLELLIGVMAFVMPKHKLFYINSLIMMFGIAITRLETAFISILCIIMLIIIPPCFKRLKYSFMILFCFSLSLILIKMGFA
jgi:hypothetical protein